MCTGVYETYVYMHDELILEDDEYGAAGINNHDDDKLPRSENV